MVRRPSVLCVGLATVDLVHRVSRLPGVDEKVEALDAASAAGGPATNAAVAAAALGADVTLVTALGRHPLARLVRDDLTAHRVTVCDTTPHATHPPPVSAVTVLAGTGQRTIVSRNGADLRAPAPAQLSQLSRTADVVLIDGHHPDLARAAAPAARTAGRPVLLDAGSWRPVFAALLPYTTVAACSAAFRPPADGTAGAERDPDLATIAALRAAGVPHIAVTHGPDPVRWWSGGRDGTVVVPAVPAVDTAGAGDAFHGALAVALAADPQVTDLPAALRRAVDVAGIRVCHAGPRAWLADPRLGRNGAVPPQTFG